MLAITIRKEHLYFGSPLNVSVRYGCHDRKSYFFLVRDNLTTQGISLWVRENLTLSKKSEGGWNLTIMNSFFFSTFVLFRNIKNSLVHTYLQKLDIRRLTFRVNVVLNKTVLDSSELTQQKRGRQNACVCQTWQAYYLRVCCDVQLI